MDELHDTEPTSQGKDLIEAWFIAIKHYDRAKSDLSRAECDRDNAHNALAKWLMPDGMKAGEQIGIWYGKQLIEVSLTPQDSARSYPKLAIRERKAGRR